MVTKSKKRKSWGSKKRLIGKPTGQIQQRVQDVGPEHFGVIAVDCAKRRSKGMLCNFYGKVLAEPTPVEHTCGALQVMTQWVKEVCQAEGLTDTIVAVEMTGIYHKPVLRAFRKAGFDTRIVHPFASKHYRRPMPRPMTTIWKRCFMPPSKATAWPSSQSLRSISRSKRFPVIGRTWLSNAGD